MKAILVLVSLLALFTHCTSPTTTETTHESAVNISQTKSTFIHTVFFWCKDGITDEQRKELEQGMEKLGTVTSIQQYMYGKPAGTPRTVVDNSYDYAWITHFASSEDHDAYQVDPIHKEFVEKYQALWEKVQIYDTIIE